MTTAETISKLFGDNGQVFTSRDGLELDEACAQAGGRREKRDGGSVRWLFSDASAITVHGDAWDIGFAGCWCWQGVGHDERCTARPVTESRAAAMLGAKGGAAKSEAKTAAARANGRLGGRPPSTRYRCTSCHRPGTMGSTGCHPAAGIELVPRGATLARSAPGLVETWETAEERGAGVS